jgi:hypothetical protein
MDLWRPPGFTEEKMQRLRLKAPADAVDDYFRRFVNRRAYTLQSDRPHPKSGRHYYYRPTDKATGQGLHLTSDTIRGHIEGEITIGLYAINPATQQSKWVAIDADYKGAMEDLVKLQYYLSEDQVQAALEMSQRGGHLWIFLETPLLARDCRIYIHDLASRLGVPVKGNGLAEGIEIFPKHDELGPGEFGNAIRGPLGIHRGASRRFWFYGAEYDPGRQMAYLKQLQKVGEEDMRRFVAGKTLPAETARRPRCPEPAVPRANSGGVGIPHSRARRKGSQGWQELRHSLPLLCGGGT